MDLLELNKQLNALTAPERLKWMSQQYPEGMVFSTSLGQEDQVITHLLARQALPVKIFTLDTGRLFQETYDLLDKTIARYKVTIHSYFPATEKVQQLITEKGPNSFYESVENRKECCYIRKVEPLNRALAGAKVWVTGLRADQSENRANLPIAEWDEAHQLIKIHPLLDWSYEQLLAFIQQENVPYNSLHDKGFPSIGCAPCTRAIEPGEDIRAGRWWWEASKKECGLHQETSIKLN
ncbi:phosphoadenylyl-sulfate reductase [Flavihumibacter sp. CACIAM 22H1]|uniref:phosphoadenylyl-sulfate reductase n=1 Tax=Flavihumibacter sp. CACIAM 22H1 TaxID=1812911 RepID=UPI0007A8F2AE|nr:phosphoadenylyl-sulfate reductase [Flavihumibacter sp. CACIAM 22H1]KYP13251.1 MAG: phosphoadenosine phosphosulfate reductase [Flavihumibacter sp. CACIAM 22H1]